jgi:hypothetical protein
MVRKTEVKVLSVKQPHADHIIFGDKWCENRSRRTRHRGQLFIHSSAKWDTDAEDTSPGDGVLGAIIGCVEIVDVLNLEEVGLDEIRRVARAHGLSTRQSCMRHVLGPMCWIVTKPRALQKPIPIKGALNVWATELAQAQLRFTS